MSLARWGCSRCRADAQLTLGTSVTLPPVSESWLLLKRAEAVPQGGNFRALGAGQINQRDDAAHAEGQRIFEVGRNGGVLFEGIKERRHV